MSRRYGWAMLGVMVGLAGCQAAPEDEHTAYLLLDQRAREAGFVIEGVDTPQSLVLPVEVEPSVELSLVGPKGRVKLAPEPDQLLMIRGQTGMVEAHALEKEVDLDRILVRGSEEAARELASVLAGELSQRDDGAWEIRGINALGESSRVSAPSGLLEVMPGAPGEAPSGKAVAKKGVMPAGGSLDSAFGPLQRASVLAAPGSIADGAMLAWDALLPSAVNCTDPLTGVWMSHEYHPALNEWYVFTVKIHRESAATDAIVGEIRSEFWEGGASESKIPACDAEEVLHGAVKMPASGVVQGSKVNLRGSSWQRDNSACIDGWSRGYNLDNFTGIFRGSELHTVNNDGGRSIDDATHFRRISCD